MNLREQIRIAIGGALAAQEGSDGAADAVMEVLAKQEPAGTLHDDGYFVWRKTAPHQSNYAGWKMVLYALPGAQSQPTASVPGGWLRAIDEALVVAHVGVANESDTYEQAKAKLDSLIGFHVDVATDPAVNGGWKLAPIVSTDEMDRAGADHTDGYLSTAQMVWDAMLATAPKKVEQ